MLRPFAFEIALFALPFLGYLLWRLMRGGDPFANRHWSGRPLAVMVAAGLLCMLAGLALFGHFREAPANSVYIPAHLDNGKIVAPALK